MDAPAVQVLGDGELLEGAVDAMEPDLRDLLGAELAVHRELSHAGRFPDQMNVVLGDRVEHLVVIRQAQGRRLAPSFRKEIIEEARVPSHDPHAAARAFRAAEDIWHAEDLRA
jgi:hypothetical protein